MQYLIIFLVGLKSHLLISLLALLGLGFTGLILPIKRIIPITIILFFVLFFNIFTGHVITNYLLEHFGDKGEGMVVAISETSNIYNDQPVMKYEVMLKSDKQKPVTTYFLSDDFNIIHQKSWNEYVYPSPGIRFNVYYLKQYPRAFVIIANDDSDYARSLECYKDVEEISRLQNQLKMDPDNAEIKEKLNKMIEKNKTTLWKVNAVNDRRGQF
jgi:hypothetical protein